MSSTLPAGPPGAPGWIAIDPSTYYCTRAFIMISNGGGLEDSVVLALGIVDNKNFGGVVVYALQTLAYKQMFGDCDGYVIITDEFDVLFSAQ